MVWFLQGVVCLLVASILCLILEDVAMVQVEMDDKAEVCFQKPCIFFLIFFGGCKSLGWHQQRDSGLACWDFGRLLHRQRKEAAGKAGGHPRTWILLALVSCQSFIVLVDRMISHFHSFSDLLLKLLISCRWWFPCGGSVCKRLF